MTTIDVRSTRQVALLSEIQAERQRAATLHPETDKWPDGTGERRHAILLSFARTRLSESRTWANALRCEVAEALVETDAVKLRTELVQVAGMALRWLEALEVREGR